MSEDRPSRSSLPEDKDRLNLQLNKALKHWAKGYARRKNTTMTALITQHFERLKEEEDNLRGHIDVEQI